MELFKPLYINNQKDVAAKIADQSNKGTNFLLLDIMLEPEVFQGINYLDTIILKQTEESLKRINNPLEKISKEFYLHVYEK